MRTLMTALAIMAVSAPAFAADMNDAEGTVGIARGTYEVSVSQQQANMEPSKMEPAAGVDMRAPKYNGPEFKSAKPEDAEGTVGIATGEYNQ